MQILQIDNGVYGTGPCFYYPHLSPQLYFFSDSKKIACIGRTMNAPAKNLPEYQEFLLEFQKYMGIIVVPQMPHYRIESQTPKFLCTNDFGNFFAMPFDSSNLSFRAPR